MIGIFYKGKELRYKSEEFESTPFSSVRISQNEYDNLSEKEKNEKLYIIIEPNNNTRLVEETPIHQVETPKETILHKKSVSSIVNKLNEEERKSKEEN